MTYKLPDNPLFASVDPNREFIRNAVGYLVERQHKDRKASEILHEHFVKSEALTDETLPQTLESELTFRDEAVGDKLEALKKVSAMVRFINSTVYREYTERNAPERKELVQHLNATRQALKVLYAPYVDEQYMRDMCAVLEEEAIRDGIVHEFPDEFEDEPDIGAAIQ